MNLEREDKARLKKLVKSLKGSKEDLKKREISPIQQTKVVRTAQELIDLIDSGWSTAEEFIYIYSVLCNSDLPDDERSKFFESGRGNVRNCHEKNGYFSRESIATNLVIS